MGGALAAILARLGLGSLGTGAIGTFVGSMLGGLVAAAGSFFGSAMISLGVGFVTFTGFTKLLDYFKDFVEKTFDGLPVMILQGAGMLKIDIAISIMFSAISIRLLLNGLRGGAIKQFAIKQ
jgi:hypothetical protein